VTVDELLPLVGAVSRSARRALVVADLPFGAYQSSPIQALETAVRFMKEGGAHAVKLEGGAHVVPHVEAIVQAGIPVMAHIGFTPQSEHAPPSRRVAGGGRRPTACLALEEAGAFAVVLEMVPSDRRTDHRRVGHTDHRHRRRPALRRTGARLAGHGRAAQGADAAGSKR
jgi:3-methyl-2-oxobutanoate hydroxymethyltransferase